MAAQIGSRVSSAHAQK